MNIRKYIVWLTHFLLFFGILCGGFALEIEKNSAIAAYKSQPELPITLLVPFDKNKPTIATSGGAIAILQGYIGPMFKFGLAFTSVFAVTMIMFAGYEYMFAGGESGTVDRAKKRIGQTLGGVFFLFCAALLLNAINPTFFIL